jgi:hypothetical protein
MNNRRKTTDRRGYDLQQDRMFKRNRRTQADRRLNNIKVEWIPIRYISLHPATRLVFSKR